jgi:competence protein ComEA
VPEVARGTVLTWVVAAVLATLAVVRLVGGADGSPPAPVKVDGAARPHVGGTDGAGGEKVFVHVAGAVRRPGLYRLRADARVAEAVQRAGGPKRRAELAAVNLAARVEDGQQVVVPTAGAIGSVASAAAGSPGSTDMAGAPGVKLSLGTATAEQLEELDGIGPTLAERIIEYREANGGFSSLGQLRDVDGIGEKRYASLREALQP